MSSTISDIRRALMERVQQSGIHTLERPPGAGVPNQLPAAFPTLLNGSYAQAFAGEQLSGSIRVRIIAAAGDSDDGWAELDKYISATGSESIVRAIEEDSQPLPDVTWGVMGFESAGFQDDLGGVWMADILVNYAKGPG